MNEYLKECNKVIDNFIETITQQLVDLGIRLLEESKKDE